MDTTQIDLAIEAAFTAALANPQKVASATLAPNVTLRTDVYIGPQGSGFRVTATINLTPALSLFPAKIQRVKQHGPDTSSNREWPTDAAIQQAVLGAYRTALVAAWKSTFTAGERAFLQIVFDAAISLYDQGDIEGAKAIVSTAPSVTADLDAKRSAIVALFPQ